MSLSSFLGKWEVFNLRYHNQGVQQLSKFWPSGVTVNKLFISQELLMSVVESGHLPSKDLFPLPAPGQRLNKSRHRSLHTVLVLLKEPIEIRKIIFLVDFHGIKLFVCFIKCFRSGGNNATGEIIVETGYSLVKTKMATVFRPDSGFLSVAMINARYSFNDPGATFFRAVERF